MTIPIVIAAFGTTTDAQKTYSFMDHCFKGRFPDHEIRWAFSSRMVKEHLRKRSEVNLQSPTEVLEALYSQGHSWAVVQSLHIINGHELYRLVEEVKSLPIRTSIGLPLLSSYPDYSSVAEAMSLKYGHHMRQKKALVLVGHGTDHPAWSSYLAFESILRQTAGGQIAAPDHDSDRPVLNQPSALSHTEEKPRIFVGLIEEEPSQSQVIEAVVRSGVEKVYLVPFTLVAGVHFKEDIAGSEESWRAAFEEAGLTVEIESRGIGYQEAVVDIFMDHIQDALLVIPD